MNLHYKMKEKNAINTPRVVLAKSVACEAAFSWPQPILLLPLSFSTIIHHLFNQTLNKQKLIFLSITKYIFFFF